MIYEFFRGEWMEWMYLFVQLLPQSYNSAINNHFEQGNRTKLNQNYASKLFFLLFWEKRSKQNLYH